MPEVFDVFVCVDCGFFLANGEPDETDPRWNKAALLKNWEGYHLVNGDTEKDHEFSWTPCEGCGTKAGGTRMHCVAWKEDPVVIDPVGGVPLLKIS
jgi:hypothetical protein